MSLEIIKEKVAQAVDILNEKNIDMWVTFVQETKVLKDPIMGPKLVEYLNSLNLSRNTKEMFSICPHYSGSRIEKP